MKKVDVWTTTMDSSMQLALNCFRAIQKDEKICGSRLILVKGHANRPSENNATFLHKENICSPSKREITVLFVNRAYCINARL